MPLPIRDGNQSLTTLSTILVSNAHIPAHTVVSLGTQAITDIATAVSGVELGPNTLNALENITVTLGQVTITGGLTDAQLRASAVTVGGGIYIADAQSVIGSSIPPEVVQIGGKSLADSKLYPISVDSNGVQSISGAVTASISGTPSVTFGTAVITGSTSILNFPATQTVTFTQAPVTFGTAIVTGSVSVLNIPATQTVTFSQAPVTFGTAVVTGSTSILNFPATQTVTFGTSVITGSVSVLNIPATQTVTFTQASVTFGQPTITGSVSVLNFPASQSVTFTTATVTFGTAVITGSTSVLNFPATQTVTFSQAPVTFGLISGTVTANPTGTQTIAGTVTANGGDFASQPLGAYPSKALRIGFADDENYYAVGLAGGGNPLPVILYNTSQDPIGSSEAGSVPLVISGTVTIGSALPAGTNRIGVVTIGAGTVTIGAGTAQIGSVTASLAYSQTATTISSTAVTAIPVVFPTSGAWGGLLQGYNGSNTYIYSGIQAIGSTSLASATSLPVSLTTLPALAAGTAQIGSVTASISNSLTIGSLPAISGTVTANLDPNASVIASQIETGIASYAADLANDPLPISGTVTIGAGTSQIGSVTASISNSVVTFYPMQGTTVTNSNFTSTTASTTLVSAVANREVLTVFNEGAGNLHISAGATCTTVAYQVRLSAGDYWECPQGQLSLAHTAVFATAGTARVTEVS